MIDGFIGNILRGTLADGFKSISLPLQVLRIGLMELVGLVQGAVAIPGLVDIIIVE